MTEDKVIKWESWAHAVKINEMELNRLVNSVKGEPGKFSMTGDTIVINIFDNQIVIAKIERIGEISSYGRNP